MMFFIIYSMYTLAEQFLDKIDIFEYMDHVENGLKVLIFLFIFKFYAL